MKLLQSLVCVLAVSGLAFGCSLAQRAMPGTMSDANVLEVMNTIDRSEIEAAELATQRAQSPAVREYASQLISQHHTMLEKNQQVAKQASARPEPPALATTLKTTHQETLERLRTLSGPEFDRAYLEYQVKMHEQAIKLVDSASTSAEHPALKQHLTKALPDLRNHLAKAKTIQGQLRPGS